MQLLFLHTYAAKNSITIVRYDKKHIIINKSIMSHYFFDFALHYPVLSFENHYYQWISKRQTFIHSHFYTKKLKQNAVVI